MLKGPIIIIFDKDFLAIYFRHWIKVLFTSCKWQPGNFLKILINIACIFLGNGKFQYGPTAKQHYKYTVEVSSLFNGTSRNESTLFLEGNVDISFQSPCQGQLVLHDFKLKETSEDAYENPSSHLFQESVAAYPLRFAFKDGNIYQLCPSEQETEWVLNFKRGILNMLHNTMKRFDLDFTTDEVDIRGTCPTKYNVIGAKETSLLIEKTKELNSCQGTGRIHSFVQATSIPYYSTVSTY